MKINKSCKWTRLLRTTVALMLVFAMLLCGCAGVPDEGEGSKNNNKQDNTTLENGKLEAQDAVDGISAVYGLLLKLLSGDLEMGGAKDMAMQSDIVLSLGDEIKAQLGQSMSQMGLGEDLSWFQNIGFTVTGNMKDDKTQISMDAKINGESILGVNVIMDMLNSMVYASLPGINDQIIGMPMETMSQPAPDMDDDMQGESTVGGAAASVSGLMGMLMSGELTKVFAEHTELIQALPTEQQVNELLDTYLDVVLEYVDQGTTAQETLNKAGVSQNVDTTTYVITRYDVMDAAIAAMTKAKTDVELEKALDAFSALLNAVASQQNENAEQVDLYARLLVGISGALEDLQASKVNAKDDEVLRLCVYAANDKTVGLRLTMPAEQTDKENHMTVYSLENNGKTAFYLNVADSFEFSGTGTIENGKTSGTYSLILNGVERLMVELKDFTADALNSDTLEGTVRFHLGTTLNDYVEPNVFLNENTVFELALKIDDNGIQMQWKLCLGEMMLMTLSVNMKILQASNITVPSDSVDGTDQEAMMDWASGLDLNKVLENVKDAGVPDVLVQMLLQMIQGGFSEPDDGYDYHQEMNPDYNY